MLVPHEVLRQIRHGHVQQLAQLHLQLEDFPPEEVPRSPDDLIQWINENKSAIQAAQASRCVSKSSNSPNWDAVLYALVESAAMYLRKRDDMVAAIQAAQKGNLDEAVEHLKNAQEYIDGVAEALDCTFVQLCDFSQQSPDGRFYMSGAFCGAFISNKDKAKPFIGMTYKGTNSARELRTDLDWTPVQPTDIAFGAKTHRGFYDGLFANFTTSGETLVPFDFMISQLQKVYNDNALLHFAGHSLGGAYATLTIGEFLRRQDLQAYYTFGDAYLLAAPRSCEEPFAQEVSRRTTPTSRTAVVRIVNDDDPVTTVPPRTTGQLVEYPYIHVDGAWKIFPNAPPQKMPSEQPNNPVPPESWTDYWKIWQHKAQSYYESWKNTPHT